MKILLAACHFLLFCGCSSMMLGGSTSGGQELGTDHRSSAEIHADDSLTATIRSRYALDTEISQYKIGVSTRNHAVTLSGTVGAFAIRDRAVRIARDTDGVRSVSNQIAVNTQQ